MSMTVEQMQAEIDRLNSMKTQSVAPSPQAVTLPYVPTPAPQAVSHEMPHPGFSGMPNAGNVQVGGYVPPVGYAPPVPGQPTAPARPAPQVIDKLTSQMQNKEFGKCLEYEVSTQAGNNGSTFQTFEIFRPYMKDGQVRKSMRFNMNDNAIRELVQVLGILIAKHRGHLGNLVLLPPTYR